MTCGVVKSVCRCADSSILSMSQSSHKEDAQLISGYELATLMACCFVGSGYYRHSLTAVHVHGTQNKDF